MSRIKDLWSGAYEEAGKSANKVQAQWQNVNTGMVTNAKAASAQLKEAYSSVAKEAKARIKEMTAAEREANSEVERLRKDRVDIEKRYADAISQFQGAGSGEPSFGGVQTLRAAANQALRGGNYEEAQRQAAAALQMLRDLASAGENTYGFVGIAKEIQAVELEANRLQQSQADEKLSSITARLTELKQQADIKITAEMAPGEVEKVTQQINQLAQSLAITIPVTLAPQQAATPQPSGPAPGKFATGGMVRGPGTATSDSIPALLSNGEYVMRAAAVSRLGQGFLDLLNNGMPFSRFADGGLVGAAETTGTSIPEPIYPNLGTLQIPIPNQPPATVYIDQRQALDLARLRLKFGGTKSN